MGHNLGGEHPFVRKRETDGALRRPSPFSLARIAAVAGGAKEGTAAFLVLEAAKPWSRKTHKYFPEPARKRAVELLRVGQWLKRLPNDFPIQFEVWETFVMPHMVTRDYQPPATD